MDVEAYLGQGEKYFSESQRQLVDIDSMPMPYALNCYRKLLREFGDAFPPSRLAQAFVVKLMPPGAISIAELLQRHGVASHYLMPTLSVSGVRNKFYRAGKITGKKVITHRNGDWMEGRFAVPDMKITVRSH